MHPDPSTPPDRPQPGTPPPGPVTDPLEELRLRLRLTLDRVYRQLEERSLPLAFRPILGALRPRLAASLDREPERAAALLTYAWAKIPDLLAGVVDLSDTPRVLAIVARVEEVEFGAAPAAAGDSAAPEA